MTHAFQKKLKLFLKERVSEFMDALLLLLSVADKSLSTVKTPGNKKRVLVIGYQVNFRVLKHIRWLHQSGKFEIILLTSREFQLPENTTGVSKKIFFRNKSHIKRMLIKSSNLDLMYAFASKSSYAKAAVSAAKCPVMYDPYDCFSIYYGVNPPFRWMKSEVPAEAYCFEKSNFILARNLEAQATERMHHISSATQQRILFSDYCDPNQFVSRKKQAPAEHISLVYSGGIYAKGELKSSHYFNNFFPVIEHLGKQKIDFHIYPVQGTDAATIQDYLALKSENAFIHMHGTVTQQTLTQELSQYHFGILPHIKEAGSPILSDKLKYGTSLKFFNFLEAGIPILITDEMEYMAWLVRRYHLGIVFSKNDLPNLRNIILSSNYEALVNSVKLCREKLTIEQNMNRLLTFIDSAVQHKSINN